ncbi:MAG: hypothetical protein JWN44_1453 [Myxococcales bacterium]|nr:hypothetical protein [Myxococcales bacterium]
MRRGLVVAALLTVVACAHKQAPPPAAPPPPPPPPPKGEQLRFKATAGDEIKSKVKLLIEQEQAAAQGDKRGASKPMVLIFTFGAEEKTEAVSPDGAMLTTARLVDAEGHGSPGTSQAVLDDTALAFDELKIQFKRQARGEVVSINLSGLRKPLAELTARQVLNAIYGAQRGQLFPEEHVDVGANWKTTMPIPSSSGFEGEVHYDYTYARKAAGVAVILCEGRFEGKRSPGGTVSQKLSGKSSAEYRFDVASGRLISSTVDQMTQDEGVVQGQQALQLGVRQHIRVEWVVDLGGDKEMKPGQ